MIGAVVLAAGRSRRMGRQKLLLPVAGRPMIAHIVDEVLAASVDRVVVVVGQDAAAIRAALLGRPVTFAVNPDPDAEMLSSVRRGLCDLPQEYEAALIVLGDQPGISSPVIGQVIAAFRAGGRGLVAPAYHGRRGHPLLLAMRYRDEVLANHDTTGLRGLLAAHPDDLLEVETGQSGVVDDVDTPEDYRRVCG